jgi:2-keto-4-pentenoate hydratase/2-oxohepta-3-ene-1,7-dioic acid hydratase in catechol pathway
MRLLSFAHRGRKSIGVEIDSRQVLDIPLAQSSLPQTMRGFVERGSEALESVARLLERAPRGAILQKRDLRICPPFSADERPKIFCIGANYAEHAAERGSKVPDEPTVFAKFPTSLCGPDDHIVYPPNASGLDYEAELVVVIGKRAKHVPQSEAFDYVFGYTCGNDVSERHFQRADRQWLRAKSSDTFAPTGPVIVSHGEISDPHSLALGSKVNGQVRQNYTTAQMHFQVPKLIEFISHHLTMEPGDMIFTGTPPGVGEGMKPPQFLKPGDRVEVWVEKIGSLHNTVAAAD